jgi:hypothetical protein
MMTGIRPTIAALAWVTAADARARVQRPGGGSEGRLVFTKHGDRQIARLEPHGHTSVVVDGYQGKRINSPNSSR